MACGATGSVFQSYALTCSLIVGVLLGWTALRQLSTYKRELQAEYYSQAITSYATNLFTKQVALHPNIYISVLYLYHTHQDKFHIFIPNFETGKE